MSLTPLQQGFAASYAPSGDAALEAHRTARLAAATARGLPTRRDERWRYTDLGALARLHFTAPGETAPMGAAGAMPFAGLRLRLQDGRLCDTPVLPAGLRVRALRDVGPATLGDWETPSDDPLVEFNAALAEDGVLIEVAAGVTDLPPVWLDCLLGTHAQPVAVQARVFIALGASSELSLLVSQHGAGPHLINGVTRVRLGAGARLRLDGLQDLGDDVQQVHATLAEVEAGAELLLGAYQLGARLARHGVRVDLRGEDASLGLRGLNLGRGRAQLDLSVEVLHRAHRTRSAQTYRAVAGARSRVSAISRVCVAADTSGCDVQQSLRSVLLSPHAAADQKPELEIHAHEVTASHGATIGQLDRDALFYLLSRGLDPDTARALLVFAFADEALLGLPPALRSHLEARLIAGLPASAALQGLA